MKNSISALAFTAVLVGVMSGCATRSATGPGSDIGADHVPVVAAPAQSPELYATDVAKCQREAGGHPWGTRQETVMMNCMTRRGYVNVEPSVAVTWRPIPLGSIEWRRTGVDTYNAEKLAKSRSCAALPIASLVAKGPGFESYSVACNGGVSIAVRCEFGNCRAS